MDQTKPISSKPSYVLTRPVLNLHNHGIFYNPCLDVHHTCNILKLMSKKIKVDDIIEEYRDLVSISHAMLGEFVEKLLRLDLSPFKSFRDHYCVYLYLEDIRLDMSKRYREYYRDHISNKFHLPDLGEFYDLTNKDQRDILLTKYFGTQMYRFESKPDDYDPELNTSRMGKLQEEFVKCFFEDKPYNIAYMKTGKVFVKILDPDKS